MLPQTHAASSPPARVARLMRRAGLRALHLDGDALLMVRPVGVADAARMQAFVQALSPEARFDRWFAPIPVLGPAELARITHPRAPGTGLVALDPGGAIVGHAELALDDAGAAEFGVVVAEAWRRRGLAAGLLDLVETHARQAGINEIGALVRAGNTAMLALGARLGYALRADPDRSVVRLVKWPGVGPVAAAGTIEHHKELSWNMH